MRERPTCAARRIRGYRCKGKGKRRPGRISRLFRRRTWVSQEGEPDHRLSCDPGISGHPCKGGTRTGRRSVSARRLPDRPMMDLCISRRAMIAASAVAAATPAWAVATDESDRLAALFESVFQRDLGRNPAAQSVMGVKGGQGGWPDVGQQRADENVALVRRDLAELRRFDRAALTPDAQLSYALFAHDAATEIERHSWRGNHYPVCQLTGPPRGNPQTLINNNRIASVADAEIGRANV